MAFNESQLPGYAHTAIGAMDAVAITPNDSADIPNGPVRALWIGGAGNVALQSGGGATVTFVGCAAGSILPVVTGRVMATSTTATSIVGLK
jgi:hypothetical protein